jgi:hypothetical protein
VLFFGIAVFFAAGSEKNARGEDRDNDGNDDKWGSNAHRLAPCWFKNSKSSYQLSAVSSQL